MKYAELHRKLRKAGCYLVKNGANHPHWFSPATGNTFPTSYHDGEEVKPGTLKNISKLSGIKF